MGNYRKLDRGRDFFLLLWITKRKSLNQRLEQRKSLKKGDYDTAVVSFVETPRQRNTRE